MPVQIDKIDTEIEIAPAATSVGAAANVPAGMTSAMPNVQTISMRDAIATVLESELEDYLRMRG